MTILYLALATLTIVWLAMASMMDLKERMVFALPTISLEALWSLYLLVSGMYDAAFLTAFWLTNLIIYLLMNHFEIWGIGDSDLLLLMANICLVSGTAKGGLMAAVLECMTLAAGLFIAILISRIEAKVKRENVTFERSVAVVPGMALMMAGLLIYGAVWRLQG